MITAIAEKLTNKLLSNGCLAAAEKEEIAYGFFTFFSRCFFLLICIFFGFLFRCFFESVAYYFTFLFVKKYAGGYHASTETKCILLSSISILISIIIIFFVYKNITFYPSVIVRAIIASAIICFFAPVENKEKPLTEDEKKKYKLNTLIRLCLLFVIIVTLYRFSFINFCIAIDIGLELECVFMLASKIRQYADAYG